MFVSVFLFVWCLIFFFQAEDGIRDSSVTGVQTCALPISFYPKIAPGKPLFTGYIFTKFDEETQQRLVKYSKGVGSIVSFGDKPATVYESLIEAMKARIKDGFVHLDPPSFKKGEKVEIKEGPLAGVSGIFDSRVKGSDRVIILLNAIALQSRMVIPAIS